MRWNNKLVQFTRRLVGNQRGAIGLVYLAALAALAALVWSQGNTPISLGEAVTEKLSSQQIQAAFEQAGADADALVVKLKSEKAPPYQIRFAEAKRDKIYQHAAQVRTAEKSLMDMYGEEKIKDILKNYAKGKALALTPEETQWLISEYENANKIFDAATGKKSKYQKRCESVMLKLSNLAGSAKVLTGDDLERAIAEVELDYILRRIGEEDKNMQVIIDCMHTGSDIEDKLGLYNCVKNNYQENIRFEDLEANIGVFINRLNKFWQQYPGEGTPESIRKLIEQILREKYGLPPSDEEEQKPEEELKLDLSKFNSGSWFFTLDNAQFKTEWKNGVVEYSEGTTTIAYDVIGEFSGNTYGGSTELTDVNGWLHKSSMSATFNDDFDTVTKLHLTYEIERPTGKDFHCEIDATDLRVQYAKQEDIFCVSVHGKSSIVVKEYLVVSDKYDRSLVDWTYGKEDLLTISIKVE